MKPKCPACGVNANDASGGGHHDWDHPLNPECHLYSLTWEQIEGAREAIREAVAAENAACAEIARGHGNFCDREAQNGGDRSLFERAEGAWYIASKIVARQSSDVKAREETP